MVRASRDRRRVSSVGAATSDQEGEGPLAVHEQEEVVEDSGFWDTNPVI